MALIPTMKPIESDVTTASTVSPQLGVSMNCSTNTMLKVAAGLGLTLVAAYFAFPAAQTMLLASAPYLLLLICPISMGVMMLMMRGPDQSKGNESSCSSAGGSQKVPDTHAAIPGKV